MKPKEWFDGLRLSTEEQDEYVERLLKDKARSIETGDTLVLARHGFITVYRQDFSHQLSAKEAAFYRGNDE